MKPIPTSWVDAGPEDAEFQFPFFADGNSLFHLVLLVIVPAFVTLSLLLAGGLYLIIE